jgi:hypothetical protein
MSRAFSFGGAISEHHADPLQKFEAYRVGLSRGRWERDFTISLLSTY